MDVLQDLCSVGYYSLDQQEANCFDFQLRPVRELLNDLSYSNSYVDAVVETAGNKGIQSARYLVAQFDFSYDPKKVTREVAVDPVFIGVFRHRGENF